MMIGERIKNNKNLGSYALLICCLVWSVVGGWDELITIFTGAALLAIWDFGKETT